MSESELKIIDFEDNFKFGEATDRDLFTDLTADLADNF